MRVRPATPADLPAIRGLEARCATAAHWSEEDYSRLFEGHFAARLVVVADDGEVRGFIVGREIFPEWEIENLVVAENSRRCGLGSTLLDDFLRQAGQRRAEAVHLEVRASNAAARKLYEKHGFRESGRRRLYYHEPAEDAVLYRLWLGGHVPSK